MGWLKRDKSEDLVPENGENLTPLKAEKTVIKQKRRDHDQIYKGLPATSASTFYKVYDK